MGSFDRIVLRTIGLAALGLMLASCGGANAPSEENFKAALNDYFLKTPECLKFVGSGTRDVFARIDDRAPDQTFEILADAGYLRREATETRGTNGLEVFVYPATNYYVTEKGEPFFFQENQFINLCYGTREVVEVTNFSDPQKVFGYLASTVSFTSALAGAAEWAADERLYVALPDLEARLLDESVKEESADLVLTDDGWVHHAEVTGL